MKKEIELVISDDEVKFLNKFCKCINGKNNVNFEKDNILDAVLKALEKSSELKTMVIKKFEK